MQCRASRAEDSSFVKERKQAPLADTGLSRSVINNCASLFHCFINNCASLFHCSFTTRLCQSSPCLHN